MSEFDYSHKMPYRVLLITSNQESITEDAFENKSSHNVEAVSNMETAFNILRRQAFEYSAVVFDARSETVMYELKQLVSMVRNHFSSIYPLVIVVSHEKYEKFFLEMNVDYVVNNLEAVERILKESQEICRIPQNYYIDLLAKIIKYRDPQLFAHMTNVRRYSLTLAELCVEEGLLSDEILERIGLAAFLHDIGKILIADEILRKPSKLTNEEFEIIKKHTVLGAEILRDIVKSDFAGKSFSTLYESVKYHHERWDGKGYPSNLTANDIPVVARIVAIADSFDALTSDRYYRPAYNVDEALRIMNEDNGHFDPLLYSVFLKNIHKFK